MDEKDLNFQENVKKAFKQAKNDINSSKIEIKGLKLDLNDIKSNINDLKQEISKILPYLEDLSVKKVEKISESSTGNEGVFNKQTNKQTVKQLNTQQLNTISDLQSDLMENFKLLTKQEFLAFLAIYQLEEELEIVRFKDVASHLNLSETSIRGYVSRLIDKNIPISKVKINNLIVNLSLLPEFRKLDLKKPLTNMYYNLDPLQKSLEEPY
jgi:DNA-binding MarR family transcriptional regulator